MVYSILIYHVLYYTVSRDSAWILNLKIYAWGFLARRPAPSLRLPPAPTSRRYNRFSRARACACVCGLCFVCACSYSLFTRRCQTVLCGKLGGHILHPTQGHDTSRVTQARSRMCICARAAGLWPLRWVTARPSRRVYWRGAARPTRPRAPSAARPARGALVGGRARGQGQGQGHGQGQAQAQGYLPSGQP